MYHLRRFSVLNKMTSLPKVFSVVFIILFCLISFGQEETEQSPHFELSVPLVLIRGIEYPFTYGDNTNEYIIIGYGIKVKQHNDSYSIVAKYDSLYYLDVFQDVDSDTSFIERIYFDVVWQPEPKISWGSYNQNQIQIELKKSNITELRDLNIECGWQDSRNLKWEIIKIDISFNGQHFRSDGSKLDDEVLAEISELVEATDIFMVLTYSGPDGIRRIMRLQKSILLME
jgi:hypothetical protein